MKPLDLKDVVIKMYEMQQENARQAERMDKFLGGMKKMDAAIRDMRTRTHNLEAEIQSMKINGVEKAKEEDTQFEDLTPNQHGFIPLVVDITFMNSKFVTLRLKDGRGVAVAKGSWKDPHTSWDELREKYDAREHRQSVWISKKSDIQMPHRVKVTVKEFLPYDPDLDVPTAKGSKGIPNGQVRIGYYGKDRDIQFGGILNYNLIVRRLNEVAAKLDKEAEDNATLMGRDTPEHKGKTTKNLANAEVSPRYMMWEEGVELDILPYHFGTAFGGLSPEQIKNGYKPKKK